MYGIEKLTQGKAGHIRATKNLIAKDVTAGRTELEKKASVIFSI